LRLGRRWTLAYIDQAARKQLGRVRVQDHERVVLAEVLVHTLDEHRVTTELARASA
jgi:hypothetical protein